MFPAQQFARDWAYPYKKLLESHLNSHTNNVICSCIQSSHVKYFTAVQVHFQWFTKSTVKQHLRSIQLGQPSKLALEDIDWNTTIIFDSRKPKSTKPHYMNQLRRHATELELHPTNMIEDNLISNTSWKPFIHSLRQSRKPVQYGWDSLHDQYPFSPSSQISSFPPYCVCTVLWTQHSPGRYIMMNMQWYDIFVNCNWVVTRWQ